MVDPRLYPCNGRVAHSSLQGQVHGVTFVQGAQKSVITPLANLYQKPNGGLDRQILFGGIFLVLEHDSESGFSFGRTEFDGYVGYVENHCLGPDIAATHKVTAINTHIYPEATMKSVPYLAISLGACLEITGPKDGFALLKNGGYIPEQAIDVIDAVAPDFVTVAEQYLGVGYLWGGCSSQGLDCSALIQEALRSSAIECPRDSDMQQAQTGTEFGDNEPLKRGDLIFWKGHVGVMIDETILLHANAHHMCVAKEPLEDAQARILENEGLDIVCRKRV